MPTVIKVNNLSKRYRLGLKESSKDTLFAQIGHTLTAPARNFKRLRSMTNFGQDDDSVFWALKDINFEVQQGEVLGIIGHNGAGKSTLLKLLSRITEPTTGSIALKGRVAALLEVGTGFHQDLTGRENIYMNGTILGMTKKEIDLKLDEIVDFSGVEKYLDTPVKFYSSGMKVRLGFSVAAHLDPEILIVDEVLAVGDAEFQKKSLGKMERVAGEGRTVLLVSHNLGHINNLCNSAMVLNSGGITFQGSASAAIRHYLTQSKTDQLASSFLAQRELDAPFILTTAYLCNNEAENVELFSADDPIYVKMRFDIKEVTPNTYAYVIVKDTSGTIYLESDSNDVKTGAFDKLKPGTNYIDLEIPSRVLPVGEFIVYVNFTSKYSKGSHSIHSPGDILRFTVSDHSTARGPKRRALTSALSTWKYRSHEC